MIYTLTNETDDLFEQGLVRLAFDVTHEVALEIMAAAVDIAKDIEQRETDQRETDRLMAAIKDDLRRRTSHQSYYGIY